MPAIAILGGSVIGSAAALLFARAGGAVTLIDPELALMALPDDDVPRRWPGAPQAVQAHAHTARATYELLSRRPDVYDALLVVGANVLPSRGRGIAFGLTTVGRLHDLLTAGDTLPPADEVALELHAWQQDVLRHYYRETCVVDLELPARIRATLTGGEAPPTAPAVLLPEGHPVTSEEVAEAAGRDAELFRLFVRALHMMDDERQIASPATTAWVRRLLADPQPA